MSYFIGIDLRYDCEIFHIKGDDNNVFPKNNTWHTISPFGLLSDLVSGCIELDSCHSELAKRAVKAKN